MSEPLVPRAASELVARAKDVFTVERLVGEPIERDGTTLIPVVSIRGGGGGGGGGGTDPDREAGGSGEGVGFGMDGRPVGMYVLKDGNVTWEPAIDQTRMFIVGCLTAVAYFVFAWLSDLAKN